jgi:serine/threonine protein phosphatase 1
MSELIVDRDKFALLRGAQRVWAIASIHGEAVRLRALHESLSRQFQPGDRLVYLGNILGHGADVAGAMDEVLSFRRAVISAHGMFAADVVVLRGAQEEMWQKLLQLQLALNPGEVFDWMMAQGIGATLESYGGTVQDGRAAARGGAAMCARWTAGLRDRIHARAGHTQLMSALRRAAVNLSPAGQPTILFVNAGIDPGRPLEAQKDSFWWPPRGLGALDGPYGEFARIVAGYDRDMRGVTETPFTLSIDAGAGRGGKILAACIESSGALVETLEA